jgi:hypothetical protein
MTNGSFIIEKDLLSLYEISYILLGNGFTMVNSTICFPHVLELNCSAGDIKCTNENLENKN